MHLGLDIARTQVLYKEALERDATMLGATRKDDEHDNYKADGNHESIGESAQEIADVEDKANGDDYAYQDGEQQWQTVAIALGPQGFPLLAAILLHNHGAQEGGDECHGKHARDGVGIPMQLPTWQHFAGNGQHKGKHQGD